MLSGPRRSCVETESFLLPALEVAPISQRRRAFEETARRPGPRRYRHYGGMDGRAAVKWGGGLAHRHDLEGEARRLILRRFQTPCPAALPGGGAFLFPRSAQHISASPAWIRLPLRHMSEQAYPRHNNTSYEDHYSIVPII